MENVIIPEAVIEAAARMLSAFIPGITAGSLREMLNANKGEKENLAARKELTRKEAATRLGVCPRTIDRFLESGRLKARKMGHSVRIPISSIEEVLSTEYKGAKA